MENLNRNVFAFNGTGGYFVAVALLLGILAALTAAAISIQQEVVKHPYKLENPTEIKAKSAQNAKHIVIKE